MCFDSAAEALFTVRPVILEVPVKKVSARDATPVVTQRAVSIISIEHVWC